MGCCKSAKLVVRAAGAVTRAFKAAVQGKPVHVPDAEFRRRLAVCASCDQCRIIPNKERTKEYHRCLACGCWLDGKYAAKARLATEECPKGLWEVSKRQKNIAPQGAATIESEP